MKPVLFSSFYPSAIRSSLLKIFTVITIFLSFNLNSNATGFAGTYTVGPGATYTSIKLALAAFNAANNSITAPVILELQANYVSTNETFPLLIGAVNGSSTTNTLTIRPAAGVTGLTITSATNPTINLNGGKNIIIDGRPGGIGSGKELTIDNSSTNPALQFINEASLDTIRYCKIKGGNTAVGGGVVAFAGTTGSYGNDNNMLSNDDIGDLTNTYIAYNLVYGLGTANTVATNNSGNTVSDCNLFNFFNPASSNNTASGIYLRSGNTDWTISRNSFYQTVNRTYTVDGNMICININNTAGNNFTVSNNYIGGTAANAGSGAWTQTGNTKHTFTGIRVLAGTVTPSNIQGNIIRNINVSCSTTNVVIGFINVGNGSINIGTTTGNIIGSSTTTGSIVYTSIGDGFQLHGIVANSTSTSSVINISNNTIGGINTGGSNTSFRGIYIQGAVTKYTVYKNLIGSETVANSITNSSTNTTNGIYSSSTSTENNLLENTIANLEASGTDVKVYLYGISIQSGVNVISGNIIHDFNSPTTYGAQGVIGINFTAASTPNQIISKNIIYGLNNTQTGSYAVGVTGILYNGSLSGTNRVSGNFIHSLSVASSLTNSNITGISCNVGTATIDNNMVRLGLKADGSSLTGGYAINGIYMQAATPNSKFYHNSIYIGGTGVSAGNTTTAFNRSTAGYACEFKNNIFVNTRVNTTAGTAKHYTILLANSSDYTSSYLSSNYNVFYAPNADNYVGLVNATFYKNLADWRSATGFDLASLSGDPNFTNATGNAAAVNLHISSPTIVEGSGTLISAVVYDFDSTLRSIATPVDIGADAANFTGSTDQSPPNISYTALARDVVGINRVLTGFATITDNVGVSGGLNSPRLYYKKSGDAEVFGANTSGTNGWKYVAASNTTSPYNFTIDYSLLRSAVALNDVIQYFVVAQDDANNFSTSPSGATAGSPPVQNVTAKPTVVNSYIIAPELSGTKIIPGNYSSITGAGGLFEDINSKVLSGNLSVTIVDDLTETGANALNQWAETGAGNYTVSITVDGTARTVTGTAVASNTPMININGADRFSISGGTGAQRRLTFRNTNSTASVTGATIQFTNGSLSNSISNCIIENNGTSNIRGNIVIGNGTNSVDITNNEIGNATAGTTGAPYNGVYASGSTNTSTVNIVGNNVYNFTGFGLNFPSLALADACTFSGNSLYQTASAPASVTSAALFTGISILSGSGHIIQSNFVGGQGAAASGSTYNNTAAVIFTGIDVSTGVGAITNITSNKIANINLSNTAISSFTGINIQAGNVTASGNLIGDFTAANNIQIAGTLPFYGIRMVGADSVAVLNDTIANIRATGTGNASQVIGIYANPGTKGYNITSNVIDKLKASAYTVTGEGSVSGISITGTNTNNVISRNIISNLDNTGTGAISPRITGLYANIGVGGIFSRNRLYNFTASASGTPDIKGIFLTQNSDPFVLVANNQIALGSNVTGNTSIQGIADSTSPGFVSKVYYNTVYVGGTVTSGVTTTAAWSRQAASISETKNNIFYNDRTGGTGAHYAISFPASSNSAGSTSDYNLLVTMDANKLAEFGTGTPQTLAQWKTSTGGSANSLNVPLATLPSSTGFTLLANGNLGINAAYRYVVGAKGNAVSETIDYAGASRNAAPGIGSVEYGIQSGVWIGLVDTAWLNIANWGDNVVPIATSNVVIPQYVPFMPTIAVGPQAVTDLSLETGAVLTLNNQTLKIAGAITNGGTITASNGTVEMNGTSTQTIPAGMFTANNLKNLIVSNNVTVGGLLNITNALTFGNVNNKNVSGGGFLTLKSNATNTARIADVTNGGANSGNTITGDVVVERYLAGINTRSYRLLASSVNTATSTKPFLRDNWQEGANNTSLTVNNNGLAGNGFGTHISGSTTGANGLDATQSGVPSLYTYNGTSYVAVTSTLQPVQAKTAYAMFVRGDRSTITRLNGENTAGSTTLRATGTLLTGNQTYTLNGNNKFTLISNPYASPISWDKINPVATPVTGISTSYIYIDPRVGGQGGYVSVTNAGINSTPGTNATVDIQSGQSFFIKSDVANSPATLTITEVQKSTTNNLNVFRAGGQEQLSLGLFYDLDGVKRIADGVNMLFNNNYSAEVDGNDAEQLTNFDEDISIKSKGKYLAIEFRPLVDNGDTIFLNMTHMKVKDYHFEFYPASFNAPGLQAYLQDSFLGTETSISLANQTDINFSVTSATASAAADRFRIVFKGNAVLPINFTMVKAFEKGSAIQVDWNLGNEQSVKLYEIEKSTDGRTFTKVGTQTKRTQLSTENYNWLDVTPATGNNYYRIKGIEQNGQYKYSQVVNVKMGKGNADITVYPNPVKGNVINLQMVNQPIGKYAISLVNTAGQQVYATTLNHLGGSATEVLSVGTLLTKGVYTLKISTTEKTNSQKVFVE